MRYKTESSVLRTLSHKETIGKWWCLFDVLIPSSSNGADPPPQHPHQPTFISSPTPCPAALLVV